jgi:hypothetical protein
VRIERLSPPKRRHQRVRVRHSRQTRLPVIQPCPPSGVARGRHLKQVMDAEARMFFGAGSFVSLAKMRATGDPRCRSGPHRERCGPCVRVGRCRRLSKPCVRTRRKAATSSAHFERTRFRSIPTLFPCDEIHGVIYARYSSDLQSPTSLDDQVQLCRAYADRNG